MGLLKSPTGSGSGSGLPPLGLGSAEGGQDPKDLSPFKEIMETLEKPPSSASKTAAALYEWPKSPSAPGAVSYRKPPPLPLPTSPPKSADFYSGSKGRLAGGNSPSFFFFHNLAVRRSHMRIPRSSSMRTPSPPPLQTQAQMTQRLQSSSTSGFPTVSPPLPPPGGCPLATSSTPGSFQVNCCIEKFELSSWIIQRKPYIYNEDRKLANKVLTSNLLVSTYFAEEARFGLVA